MIVAHLGTHRDSKAVPGVDGGQGKHQRNQFVIVEVRSCALEDRVGHMALRDPGDGVSKRERRAFALGVRRRLLPRVEHVESLLGLAAVSWYCPHLESSLELIGRGAPEYSASIIDIGGGESPSASMT